MADSQYTALLLVIDRSGSMSSIREDMVGGLTALVEEQKKQPGLLTLNLVQFDDEVEVLHHLADPAGVTIEIDPRGRTALYDAVGVGINTLAAEIDELPEHAKPGTVQVIVVTDGHENASSEYTGKTIKKLITEKTKKDHWDVVFLGANQDAVMKAAEMGINEGSSMTYSADSTGVANASSSLNRYVNDRRTGDRTAFSPQERRKSSGE